MCFSLFDIGLNGIVHRLPGISSARGPVEVAGESRNAPDRALSNLRLALALYFENVDLTPTAATEFSTGDGQVDR